MPVAVGDIAPDFTLKDQNNEDFVLSSFRGDQAVLIVFYPLAFTGICTGELQVVQRELASFQNDNVQVVTISVDSVFSHKIFSLREGFEFPLLADFWPHGEVARRYGVFNDEGGFSDRGTFLVDRDGIVRFTQHYGANDGREPSDWLDAIHAL